MSHLDQNSPQKTKYGACIVCGKPVNRKGSQYCSRECRDTGQTLNVLRTFRCPVCKGLFKDRRERVYCSYACRNIGRNKTRQTRKQNKVHPPPTGNWIKLNCNWCLKPFWISKYDHQRGRGRYCSVACSNKGRRYERKTKEES